MKEDGINLVSVGIFSWVLLEPREGEYDFEWLDHLMNLLTDAGIRVHLGTPTAAPPAWFWKQYPQARPVTREGMPLGSGSRAWPARVHRNTSRPPPISPNSSPASMVPVGHPVPGPEVRPMGRDRRTPGGGQRQHKLHGNQLPLSGLLGLEPRSGHRRQRPKPRRRTHRQPHSAVNERRPQPLPGRQQAMGAIGTLDRSFRRSRLHPLLRIWYTYN
jgi:hypothetical protein